MYLRTLITAAGAGTLLAVTMTSRAQAPPSDTDLRAAYCNGMLNARHNDLSQSLQEMPAGVDARIRQQFEAKLRETDQLRQRLHSYVMLKGATGTDLTGILIATHRGAADWPNLVTQGADCLKGCYRPDGFEASCVQTCDRNEFAERVRSCENLSWLPF